MNPHANLVSRGPEYGLPHVAVGVVLLLAWCLGIAALLQAIPDIARRIAPPCQECFLGAFVPPLDPYRDPFRPPGDPVSRAPAAEIVMRTSFAALPGSRPEGSARWLASRDMIGFGRTLLFGTDRVNRSVLPPNGGSVTREVFASGIELPHARASGRFEQDFALGAAAGGKSTARDPAWILPNYRANAMPGAAPPPGRATTQGPSWFVSPPAGRAGPGGSRSDVLSTEGHLPAVATPWIQGAIPYWHVALRKDLERHFLQLDTYGMNASVYPSGSQSAGTRDMVSDLGAGANYRLIVNPGDAVSGSLSAHASLVHEARSLDASNRVLGVNGFNTLDTFRAGASWNIAEMVTPSVQYFRTAGSVDAIQYPWPGGRPNSAGMIAEVAYVPRGPGESLVQMLNLRLAAQYVAYTEFNGIGRGAGGNNALYLSLWGTLRF